MTVKSKQRYKWSLDYETGIAKCLDKVTNEVEVFDLGELPDDIHSKFALYSIPKRLQELTSQVDLADKLDEYVKRWSELCDGVWSRERKGGGLGIVPAYIEVVAMKRGWKGTAGIAKAQRAWKATSDEVKAELLELWHDDIEAIKEARRTQDEVESLDDLRA